MTNGWMPEKSSSCLTNKQEPVPGFNVDPVNEQTVEATDLPPSSSCLARAIPLPQRSALLAASFLLILEKEY
ncbi:MAG: hypothetical protein KDI30_04795 [Pseudomonadales bacterium]|nr:hypothetical protein [Pseudomonadales bacterium]